MRNAECKRKSNIGRAKCNPSRAPFLFLFLSSDFSGDEQVGDTDAAANLIINTKHFDGLRLPASSVIPTLASAGAGASAGADAVAPLAPSFNGGH